MIIPNSDYLFEVLYFKAVKIKRGKINAKKKKKYSQHSRISMIQFYLQ